MAEAYLAAEERGVLTQGVNLAFRADPRTWEKDMAYIIEMRKKIESSSKNKNLNAVTIKYFADGVIEGGTAAGQGHIGDKTKAGIPQAVLPCDFPAVDFGFLRRVDAGINIKISGVITA